MNFWNNLDFRNKAVPARALIATTLASSELIAKKIVVGSMSENTYLVGSKESGECILIDPGAQADLILQEVEEAGLRVVLMVNTHGHGDHNGAIKEIKERTGAEFRIHQADVRVMAASMSWAPMMITGYQMPPPPDGFLNDGDELRVGGVMLMVLETPGHTPGSVCFYGEGMVFTGDTLFKGSIGRFDMDGGSGPQLLGSIESRLLTLPDDTVVMPGHGEGSTIGDERRNNPFLR